MCSVDETQTVANFTNHLCERAGSYFPAFGDGDVEVTLLSDRQRTNSALYRFQIAAESMRRVVYVKVPSLRGGDHRDQRPYFIPETDPSTKYRVQHKAMVALYDRFGDPAETQFGAIRPLELLPEHAAFVMEEAEGRTIGQILPGLSRLRSPLGLGKNRDVFENIGAWLREFHEMPITDDLELIRPKCADFIGLMKELTSYLGDALNDEPGFRCIAERAEAAASDVLKDPLPMGPRFGDFGLSNVLVSGSGRITGFDTLAIWSAPVYEDIGYFLSGLKTYRAQVLSLGHVYGAHRIAALESAFLKGYFNTDSVPLREVRLYEVLRSLERWSAKFARTSQRQRGAAARARTALINHFMRRTVTSLLDEACRP